MNPAYFLVAVSTRINLDLCIRHAQAGFTNSQKGAWTFHEIKVGDYISFLYGARARNLYHVIGKRAFANAASLPPWMPITFEESGRTYDFPFRLDLKPVRLFNESLVRSEFAYVAENLLLRAGYAKTHFQADQTTLQSVSQMGQIAPPVGTEYLTLEDGITCEPHFVLKRAGAALPRLVAVDELILQTAIRVALSESGTLGRFLGAVAPGVRWRTEVEILGEKGLSYGHVDLFVKEAIPIGKANNLAVEVKLRKGLVAHVDQVASYVEELGPECVGGVLIAEDFEKKAVPAARERSVALVQYKLALDGGHDITLSALVKGIVLDRVAE